jgi:hypothetical protein
VINLPRVLISSDNHLLDIAKAAFFLIVHLILKRDHIIQSIYYPSYILVIHYRYITATFRLQYFEPVIVRAQYSSAPNGDGPSILRATLDSANREYTRLSYYRAVRYTRYAARRSYNYPAVKLVTDGSTVRAEIGAYFIVIELSAGSCANNPYEL